MPRANSDAEHLSGDSLSLSRQTGVVMPQYLTTRELAELLRIKERKVYDLAASGTLPCSRATGKLLFPSDAISAWIRENSTETSAASRPVVFLGSHDPLLDWALRESGCGIPTLFESSGEGLQRFANKQGLATGLHVFTGEAKSTLNMSALDHPETALPESDPVSWNLAVVSKEFSACDAVLVEWAKRCRGFVLGENISSIELKAVSDLRGLRLVPRQEEAGSQRLLVQWLKELGLSLADFDLTAVALTESDAALQVLEGKADFAFGLETLARSYGLGFHPVVTEHFDVLVDRKTWFDPPLQSLVEFCRSPALGLQATQMGGYDISGLFKVRFNGA